MIRKYVVVVHITLITLVDVSSSPLKEVLWRQDYFCT